MINPLIDSFIVNFGWTEDTAPAKISLLSMVNPLGGLIGAFLGKTLVRAFIPLKYEQISYGRYKAILISNAVIIVSTIPVSDG